MKTTHSLISPSNFERRKLCPGSLNAEKNLPNTTSKYAEEGTMLHDRVNQFLMNNRDSTKWKEGLDNEQIEAVLSAVSYYDDIVNTAFETTSFHEKKFDLSFIHKEMKKGTVDCLVITPEDIHVIDYKFGKGILVRAKDNYQLILYYLGAVNDTKVKQILGNVKRNVHLHIAQPFRENSCWSLTDNELEFYSNIDMYKQVAIKCYSDTAERVASTKACQFCKVKATCPALAAFVPDIKKNLNLLSDNEIGSIYDNRELISLYMKSIEEHIKNKLDTGSFLDYTLRPKLSRRKWNEDAEDYLIQTLDDKAYEVTKKLIGITKAEKLLGKETVKSLTMKEEGENEIAKINYKSQDIFNNINDN